MTKLRVILEVGKKRRLMAGAIHRTAHHVMDHAWEMEDRDLTPR